MCIRVIFFHFRERYLLVDEADTDAFTKQRVAEIIGKMLNKNYVLRCFL